MNRRAFLAGLGAALVLPAVARAQAATQADWYFRVTSADAFGADLKAFTDGEGYNPLLAPDASGHYSVYGAVLQPQNVLRFDFLFIPNLISVPAVLDASGNVVTAAIAKGPHVNARISPVPGQPDAMVQQVWSTLTSQLRAFFAAQTGTLVNTIPAQYGGGTQTWKQASGGTAFIDPAPAVLKNTWA